MIKVIVPRCMLVSAACVVANSACGDDWAVASPDGKTVLSVGLYGGDPHIGGQARLYYAVAHDQQTVLPLSWLGIVRKDAAFDEGLVLDAAPPSTTHDETYTALHGKRKVVLDHYNERVLTFRNPVGNRMELYLRAYDDGIAFRYRFPEEGQGPKTVVTELTAFCLPENAKLWAHPYDDPGEYKPAYETYWEDSVPVGTPSPNRAGWAFPVLFQTPKGHWGLITEAAVDASYCGSRLEQRVVQNNYRLRFPDPGEGNGTGDVGPSWKLPWATPWRVVLVGGSLAPIVESTLVENLNPPSKVKDTSWIKPGRASWSWLFDPPSPQDATKLKAFVDLAADMGWEYTLIDANWDIMKNGTIHDVIAHAKSKGVGVLMWYNSGGPHNVVTERTRGLMTQRKIRRFEFERLAKWGVKGVKIDFFQSDKQNIMALYQEILEDAADYKIMVDFHGCTMPRGWSRTYPHLMSMEAVRGEECYLFDPKFPAYAPRHNTTLPYTRNTVGPMDYTPVMLQVNKNPLVTTPGHEMALSIVFESALLHFAGGPEEYRRLPEVPKQFLKTVPTAWDETRFLAGQPGKLCVLTRRAGETWYVAGIDGSGQPREIDVELSFLGPGAWSATLIEDGHDKALTTRTVDVEPAAPLRVAMLPNGGFVAILTPKR